MLFITFVMTSRLHPVLPVRLTSLLLVLLPMCYSRPTLTALHTLQYSQEKGECEGRLWERKLQESRTQEQSEGADGLEIISSQSTVSLVPALRSHSQQDYYKIQTSTLHRVRSKARQGEVA